jgi:tetrahydromethanopterin S-methyltransferase subunit G
MGVVEDVRKGMQDFLAPELREITARLDALEKKSDRHHEETTAVIRQVADYTMVIQRLTKLEAQAQMKQ